MTNEEVIADERYHTCEDCISRDEALRIAKSYYHAEYVVDKIRQLPSVTPSIPDVENNYNIGYNCGYADAMRDIAESEE